MKTWKALAVFSVALPLLLSANAKGKKRAEISSAFANAHYVYIQAVDGDIMNPAVYQEDRDAISNVQQAIRDWNRYAITTERSQADLVFVVRKGRLVGLQGRGGIGSQTYPGTQDPGQVPQPGTRTTGSVGVGSQVGPEDDFLRVFTLTADGKMNGPLWTREMQDGLDAPAVLLVRQLKEAVEAAYPSQPAPQPSKP